MKKTGTSILDVGEKEKEEEKEEEKSFFSILVEDEQRNNFILGLPSAQVQLELSG